MILIMVLLFLQIFALLGLYALTSSVIAEKMSEADWQESVSMNAAPK
jgi:Tfp pilus assembly protein PilX